MRRPRILLEVLGVSGERGLHYRVHYAGAVLVQRTWNPEYDAARSLQRMGLTGKVEVWRAGKAFPDAVIDIERAAGLTIRENDRRGPEVIPWQALPDVRVTPPAAVPVPA